MGGPAAAGQGARASGSSAGASFMGVPPTQKLGSISDGVARMSWIGRVTATLRNRFKPIFQPGQSRYVSGPNNAGDSSVSQAAQGAGSLSTSTQNS